MQAAAEQQAAMVTPRAQWMAAMQYPAMMMAPMPPPYAAQHFLPYHPAPPQAPAPVVAAGGEENRTIWVGDLHYWMDEAYLMTCFGYTGQVVNIKVIRNRQTGQSEGYGFVEFLSRSTAEKVLHTLNGVSMPNTDQVFRLNWATFSMGDKRTDTTSDLSIFVGDLASDVNDAMLQETFANRYSSVKGAKVVVDANTGRSKGYGFVRFGDDDEKARAMAEMNGVHCSSRPMRIGAATPRKSSGGLVPNGASSQGSQLDGDSTNTTVFVGGLDPDVSEDDLRQAFSQYGEIASVKVPFGKQCGFVQFVHRNNAEEAMQGLHGKVLGKQTVRLSWGRNPANKQFRVDHRNLWGGMYYGASAYSGYNYAMPPQEPSVYAAAYGAYPFYGSQQQVS